MSYAHFLMESLETSGALGGFELICGGSGTLAPLPQDQVYVTFDEGKNEGEYLLGEDGPLISETVNVGIYVPELSGADICRQCAKEVCMAVIGADTQRRIVGMASGTCRYSEEYFAYFMTISFELREGRDVRNE